MTDANQYIVPQEPGLGRALTLAALVHAALLAFLWIGVQWQSETPSTIEAEVWSPQAREAAPLPEPVKTPEPEPEPQPQPAVKEAPKPQVEEPPVEKPDIALEQEKKRKALEEKKRREEAEREKEKLAKEKKRLEDEKLAKEKKRLEDEKLAKLKQEEAKRQEKEKAEKLKKEKEAAEKKRRQDEADAQMLAKIRDEDMRRMSGVTGTGGTGDAPKAQGGRASAEYGAKVAARIRSHTVFNVPVDLAGNPPVEYLVELLPDGTLRGAPRKLKSSGVPGFDEAVLRAIDKSQPFPRDEKTGAVPSKITISHKPKDQ